MFFEKDSSENEEVSLDTSVSHEHETDDNECVVVNNPKETKHA